MKLKNTLGNYMYMYELNIQKITGKTLGETGRLLHYSVNGNCHPCFLVIQHLVPGVKFEQKSHQSHGMYTYLGAW